MACEGMLSRLDGMFRHRDLRFVPEEAYSRPRQVNANQAALHTRKQRIFRVRFRTQRASVICRSSGFSIADAELSEFLVFRQQPRTYAAEECTAVGAGQRLISYESRFWHFSFLRLRNPGGKHTVLESPGRIRHLPRGSQSNNN